MDFGKVEMKINGTVHKINVREMLDITDISKDMDEVAAQLGFWGELWALAESEKVAADAYYRQWRASYGKKVTEKEPKMPEWKVKQAIESDGNFSKLKRGIAATTHNAIVCKVICDSLRIKASMLQSKGAMMRAEMDSTSMTTRSDRAPRTRKVKTPKDVERKNTMKGIFKGNK